VLGIDRFAIVLDNAGGAGPPQFRARTGTRSHPTSFLSLIH
jgi:hypothetical protein